MPTRFPAFIRARDGPCVGPTRGKRRQSSDGEWGSGRRAGEVVRSLQPVDEEVSRIGVNDIVDVVLSAADGTLFVGTNGRTNEWDSISKDPGDARFL